MIFISYSKDDIRWRERIAKHLKENENIYGRKITFQDADILAGDDFQQSIDFHVASANAAILLVSSNYLASEYIKDHELGPILKRRDIKVYWFLLSSCLWDETGLSSLQCANTREGERIISLNELAQNGKEEEINKIFSAKCREIYEYASDKVKNSVRTPKEFIYKCNRSVESQFFQMVYTERFTEKELLAYSIIGDKEDSLSNLHNAIKLKVLVNDYKNYEITEVIMPGIEVNTYFNPEQNLYLFKKQFLNALGIAYEVSKVKQWAIDQVIQQLRK
ncbi:MAG: toll/interleukin-1 receptor domain-containing protein, partial [Sphingobacteriales bacterium]